MTRRGAYQRLRRGSVAAVTSTNTLEGIEPDVRRERVTQVLRALILAGFTIFVLAGLLGVFGIREGREEATVGPLTLAVTHPTRARGGLAVPFEIEVRREGGFEDPVTVTIPTGYLALFDENGIEPDPDSATVDDRNSIQTFEPPDGDTLVIRFDVRVEPAVQRGRGATITATSGDDQVAVDIDTWIAP